MEISRYEQMAQLASSKPGLRDLYTLMKNKPGLSEKDLAARLGKTPKTIRTWLRQMDEETGRLMREDFFKSWYLDVGIRLDQFAQGMKVPVEHIIRGIVNDFFASYEAKLQVYGCIHMTLPQFSNAGDPKENYQMLLGMHIHNEKRKLRDAEGNWPSRAEQLAKIAEHKAIRAKIEADRVRHPEV